MLLSVLPAALGANIVCVSALSASMCFELPAQGPTLGRANQLTRANIQTNANE